MEGSGSHPVTILSLSWDHSGWKGTPYFDPIQVIPSDRLLGEQKVQFLDTWGPGPHCLCLPLSLSEFCLPEMRTRFFFTVPCLEQ